MSGRARDRKSWAALKRERAEALRDPRARRSYERAREAFALAQLVRETREAKGMSQTDLARQIGTTQSAIARLEAGAVRPSLPTLARVAAALGAELVVGIRGPATAREIAFTTVVRRSEVRRPT